jgi:hypothetical protein
MVCNISAEAKYIYLMASDPSDGTKYIYLTVSDPSDGTKYIYLTVSDPSVGTKYIYLIVSAPSDESKRSFWLVQHSFIDHSFAALNSPAPFDRLGGWLVIVLIISRCQMTTPQIYNIILRKGI